MLCLVGRHDLEHLGDVLRLRLPRELGILRGGDRAGEVARARVEQRAHDHLGEVGARDGAARVDAVLRELEAREAARIVVQPRGSQYEVGEAVVVPARALPDPRLEDIPEDMLR